MGGGLGKQLEKAKQENAKELNLMNQTIRKVPPAIGELRSLVRLNASFNAISKLPPEIGQLK